ncbi:hypothetical protein MN032_10880 [Agromyces atrinae]|uniref:hypothetical protein n=1 Tax=Agromyces atrinae TaxID=592376 RepID=UPI001F57E823|nr:hypothetical protein [Agromyces atrinae]MCI2958201.1 hypothetical protein [Agromyces atrinae]
MARGRILSPEFWSDGVMTTCSPFARLFYMGMWNFAVCDRGHLPDDPTGLKLKILPADDVDGAALLDELLTKGRLIRVQTADGRPFLQMPRFPDWQKSDPRWKSRCPVCQSLTETPASFGEHDGAQPNSPIEGEGDKRGIGGGGGSARDEPPLFCSKHPNGAAGSCGGCADARRAHTAWARAQKNRPTPKPPARERECETHRGYPDPCPRCAEEAAA